MRVQALGLGERGLLEAQLRLDLIKTALGLGAERRRAADRRIEGAVQEIHGLVEPLDVIFEAAGGARRPLRDQAQRAHRLLERRIGGIDSQREAAILVETVGLG